jgi:plastocyanin
MAALAFYVSLVAPGHVLAEGPTLLLGVWTMNTRSSTMRRVSASLWVIAGLLLAVAPVGAQDGKPRQCNRTVIAEVVALDQPYFWNRLGASAPNGMIFALKRDVISRDPNRKDLEPGKVVLRPGKRPRPLVLRVNVGDCLEIRFNNLLAKTPVNGSVPTRYTGVRITGMALVPPGKDVPGVASDASWVSKNRNSLAAPGETKTYKYIAQDEGTFLLYGGGDNVDDGDIQTVMGLFGAVNVQPEWAEYYRSQVTRDDLVEATLHAPKSGKDDERKPATPRPKTIRPKVVRSKQLSFSDGKQEHKLYTMRTRSPGKHITHEDDVVLIEDRVHTLLIQPIINYHAVYKAGPRKGLPVLKMLQAVAGEHHFDIDVTRLKKLLNVNDPREVLHRANRAIPPEFREYVSDPARGEKAIKLSQRAGVTDEGEDSWLITDPGRGLYLVKEVLDKGTPKLRVTKASLHLVHSDLTAMITGPNADRFTTDLESPSFFSNPVLPDRRQPFREFTIIYHQVGGLASSFPEALSAPYKDGREGFAINYGSAAIAPEVLANRLQVGPMGNPDAVDLKFEEFFLSSWAVGDPAMVVDVPANAQNQAITNTKRGLQSTQQFLFRLEDSSNEISKRLQNGEVPKALVKAFQDNKIKFTKPSALPVVDNQQWVILDPDDPKQLPARERKRYPIVKEFNPTSKVPFSLAVYSGFPADPNAVSKPKHTRLFNDLARVKATKVFFPDDPSNVYHSNIRDHVKFRILHAGNGPAHVHHLHAHQWLHSRRSPDSQYLDSQLLVSGSAYTLDIVHHGTGNRNLTVGDSIFHCHFYPHFAQGMWSLWRAHDVFEMGTWLDRSGRPVMYATKRGGREHAVIRRMKDGKEQFYLDEGDGTTSVSGKVYRAWNRALPDGEIEAGTPIPALVPLPSLAMPLLPARVRLTDLAPILEEGNKGQGRRVEVEPKPGRKGSPPEYDNPGYPFFVPGIAGHRPPHPPMDFAWRLDPTGTTKIPLDGGLPRHVVLGGEIVREYHTKWDFTRDFIAYGKDKKPIAGHLVALGLPEEGTPVEQAAMRHHSTRTHRSYLPNGNPGNITRNGIKAKPGAPYAPPEVDEDGNAEFNTRRYKVAAIQTDVVLSRQGWHFPQQRMLTLWGDVADTLAGRRAPQPFFFRANTNDTIEFWHTNLIPSYYELDDFQVRTPTDVIGQHIHNVKFDVTSSDGSANGFNYEDGTFSPDEVRDRINAINRLGRRPKGKAKPGLLQFDERTGFVDLKAEPKELKVVPVHVAYPKQGGIGDDKYGVFGKPPEEGIWDGAQTTINRWDADPLLDTLGRERTLRTIFTHDHLGPSTHQQAGLYAGLVVEPERSQWYQADGVPMNTRFDGGPTSWEGIVRRADPEKSYREFLIEFQDTQLAYENTSRPVCSNALFDPDRVADKAFFAFDVANYPGITPDDVTALVKELNNLDNKDAPKVLTKVIFPGNGILLTDNAKVKVVEAGKAWTIQEPSDSERNAGDTYPLRLDGKALLVYTPGISPGWSDPLKALGSPSGKTPTPQLISAGASIGTYSMNYRNEPVLARLRPPLKGEGIEGATDPGFVFKSIRRNLDEFNTQPEPGKAINPTTKIEIKGGKLNEKPTWVVNGLVDESAVKPGDTVVWIADTGQHGVVFDTEAKAKAFFDFQTDKLPPLGEQIVNGEKVWGTAPQPAGTVLAQATVKPGVSPGTRLGFFCSKHGRPMSGTLTVAFFRFPAYLVQPSSNTEKGGVEGTDPYTPLLRAYANDDVQVRVLVGAHMQAHSFQIQGVRWSYEPNYPNSGYKNAQAMGISEHFEMLFKLPPSGVIREKQPLLSFADYLIAPSSSVEGLANGTWGILRAFNERVGMAGDKRLRTYLQPLPNNLHEELKAKQKALADRLAEVQKTFAKPSDARPSNYRSFKITATTAQRVLPGGALNFNPRAGRDNLKRKDAVLFVRDEDLVKGKLKDDAPREPLILRVAAGDWVEIQLTNDLVNDGKDGPFKQPFDLGAGSPFTGGRAVPLSLSTQAGLHPALVGFDITKANGINVGFNPYSTVPPPDGKGGPSTKSFYWYAGDLSVVPERDKQGKLVNYRIEETPIEYGATNLVPADMMVQPQFGMVGALIVEPKGSRCVEDKGTRASATVITPDRGSFRDFVVVLQNEVANTARSPDRFGAINYRTEPFNARGVDPRAAPSQATAVAVLQFKSGAPLPELGVEKVNDEIVWGTGVKDAPALLAQATVRSDVRPGTVLGFFCSKHGRMMSGSLAVQGARDKATEIKIEGTVVGDKPTWVVGGKPADKVAVSPGDTVIWMAAMGKHGVVFDPSPATKGLGVAMAFSNDQLVPSQDPQTPVFRAAAGAPVRFRVVMPSTSTSNIRISPVAFAIHGHGWAEEPYTAKGTKIGRNVRSMFFGAQQMAPYEAFNLLTRAGGPFAVPGDYLYEGFQMTGLQGLWGLFRVEEDLVVIQEATLRDGRLRLKGIHMPSVANRGKDYRITVSSSTGIKELAKVNRRSWTFETDLKKDAGTSVDVTVTSSLGGSDTARVSAGAAR